MKNKLYKILGGIIMAGVPYAACFDSCKESFAIFYIVGVLSIFFFILGYFSVELFTGE